MEVFLLRRLQHVRGVIRLVEYIADAPGLSDSIVIVTERIPDSCDLYDYVSRRCAHIEHGRTFQSCKLACDFTPKRVALIPVMSITRSILRTHCCALIHTAAGGRAHLT